MFNLTFPVFVFGSLIALLLGAVVHLIAGGKLLRLIFCLVFSWIGFWSGNYLGTRFNVEILHLGQVNYGPAILAAAVLSIFGYWVSGENTPASE
ncbi:MAG: hypothetical protein FJZ98_00900 [Chloroflexi bacterium]|nr:hypothetical protein [Chloroflexota bacterium]